MDGRDKDSNNKIVKVWKNERMKECKEWHDGHEEAKEELGNFA